MNCRFHPTAEAVTKCAACGVAMCSSCDTNAYFRVDKGALCLKCSLERAQDGIAWKTAYLKRLKRNIIFATIFIVLAILCFIVGHNNGGIIATGIVFWLASGLVQTWGQEKDKSSIKNLIWGDKNKEDFSFEKSVEEFSLPKFIVKVIFYAIAAPVMLIRNVIDYFGTKGMKKDEIQKHEEIYSKLNEANKEDFEYWEQEAKKGEAYPLVELALHYQEGQGVVQDYNKAIELLHEASEKGEPFALSLLAEHYYNGTGVEKNIDKAVELYKEAANRGDGLAQFQLGTFYHEGIGVDKDYTKAVELLKKSAEQGYSHAQVGLGVCYEEGTGVDKNHEKAVALWKLAAEQGNKDAVKLLEQYN